jgi:hypothetical protein
VDGARRLLDQVRAGKLGTAPRDPAPRDPAPRDPAPHDTAPQDPTPAAIRAGWL